jgi:hypothetical protein
VSKQKSNKAKVESDNREFREEHPSGTEDTGTTKTANWDKLKTQKHLFQSLLVVLFAPLQTQAESATLKIVHLSSGKLVSCYLQATNPKIPQPTNV